MKHLLLLGCMYIYLSSQFVLAQQKNPQVDQFLSAKVLSKELKQKDASEYIILSQHKSRTSKIEHIYFRQSVNGIGIIGTESSIHINPDKSLLKSNLSFETSIEDKISGKKSASLSPQLAIQKVAQQMGYYQSGSVISKPKSYIPGSDYVFSIAGISDSDIPVTLVYKKLEHSKYILVWELSIKDVKSSDWFNFYADASTGKIVNKNNWTLSCLLDHDHSLDADSRQYDPTSLIYIQPQPASKSTSSIEGSYNVYPLPVEDPFLDPREIIVNPANTIASPYGWHDTNGVPGAEFTVTRGNNVNAYEDGDNQGFQPDGGSELVFDFPFNPVFSQGDQSESAAITNLFYWNNIIHDVIYQYGFDEVSGNFQVNNYGNGGAGNDAVSAEAQDGSGTCNANFSSPPDGIPSRMQMYVCGQRDGDFDNGVIIHEYGHGISIRLTGGRTNSDCLFNDEQMGEGWSDWYGTVLTIREGDTGTDARPMGNWLFGNDKDGPGIRAFPYSTDLAINPQTYDDIKTTFGPHPLGSIWATMLWEMTWGLIDVHGFDPDFYNGTGGNNIAIALVTEALKLQPCSPGFIDGRDAILAADQALYGGENYCTIWDAFAKRGLGQSADQGSSFDRTDGVEAFDSPSTTITTPETIFCVTDEDLNLSGGLPLGGVYSGPGVTDAGDGENYVFSPLEAGVGIHTITYVANSECGTNNEAQATIEVKDENPVIECKDITITLDESGLATIVPEDVVSNFESGDGYTLDQSGSFSPENISGIETLVSLGDDQVINSIPLDFEFDFYGEEYSTFGISSNGYISFSEDFNSGCCSGQILPNQNQPNNLIALGWTDLNPANGGTISHATVGNSPNRVKIIQFQEIPNFGSSSLKVSAQIKLFEGSNRIEIHSEKVEGFALTQGIENSDGTSAIAIPGRNSEQVSITDDFIAFVPNPGSFPDNCGQETTVTIDVDSFDCNNLGENSVIATATDAAGNSTSCTATVTVISDIDVTFEELDEEFCEDQSSITGLGGGLPLGGTYSGNGVTDDGNGETFTFEPSIAGEGTTTITYSGNNSCSELGSATIDVEIQSAIPEIACVDITVPLNVNGTVTLTPEQVLGTNSNNISVYALNPTTTSNNLRRYSLNNVTNELIIDPDYNGSTGLNRNFAIEKNPADQKIYLLAGSSSSDRNLYTFNVETSTSEFLFKPISLGGDANVQAMAFDSNGNLYFAFQSGEINRYDLDSNEMNSFATIEANGSVGITFDPIENRLIHSSGYAPVNLQSINIETGDVSSLFTFFTPLNSECNAQALSYVGNGKLIASSTFFCNIIYNIDLNTESVEPLLSPTESFDSIKDLMSFSTLPVDNCSGEPLSFSLSPNTFSCDDVGENLVTVTATDSNGNTTSCSSMVTIEDSSILEFECIEGIDLELDENGNAFLTEEMVFDLMPSSICDNDYTVSLSQSNFDCDDLNFEGEEDLIINGSFEDGLTGWASTIENGTDQGPNTCVQTWKSLEDSTTICCCVDDIFPTDGLLGSFTTFDGIANSVYVLEQTFTNTTNGTALLNFDWVAEFDLQNYGATIDRKLEVGFFDLNDNLIDIIYTQNIPAGELSSINESLSFDVSDLLSSYNGQEIKLKFMAFVPESGVGPSKAMIDNVSLLSGSSTIPVEITVTDNADNSSTCIVPVTISDPNEYCILSTQEELFNNALSLYPNPTKSSFTLAWTQNINVDRLEILDLTGKLIFQKQINFIENQSKVDVSNLASGIYLVRIKSGDNLSIKKLLVE